MKRLSIIRRVALGFAVHVLSAAGADEGPAALDAAYQAQVTAAVLAHVVVPTVLSKNEWVEYRLAVRPDGRIDSVRVLESSGSMQWNVAIALALARTSVLPKGRDGRVPALLDLRLESAAAGRAP
ncbi:MAG TPA: TonB C-terminal domain-containing protein [Burkholderiaceae bacterium]|jgi:outer membrane biosynthesis protein TonB